MTEPRKLPRTLAEAEKLPMTPRSGVIGSEVTVGTAGLMPETLMLVAFANLQSYELLGRITTDKEGAFTTTVKVPIWAQVNGAHYIFVSLFDERPIAMTAPFHVASADGTTQLTGFIGENVGDCVPMKKGEVTYHLVGIAGKHRVDTLVSVTGTLVEGDPCGQQNLTIEVTDSHPF